MIRFYTLLYVNPEDSVVGNSVSGNYNEKIQKYVYCCSLLNASLKGNALPPLKVVTNNAKLLNEIDPSLETLEIPFRTKVPADIPFSSAHCKLDVLKYFSGLGDREYSVLVDSDMVCIRDLPFIFKKIEKSGDPVIYNVTGQQLPAFTAEKISGDKELLIKETFLEKNYVSNALWAGGEFIGGKADFFKTLSAACTKILPVYLKHHKKLFHNGDEMIVSTALEYLTCRRKIFTVDAGQLLLTGRLYASGTEHVQHIWKFFKQVFLLHLPMDKDFLSEQGKGFVTAEKEFDNEKFMSVLEQHLKSQKIFLNATVRADGALQKLTAFYYKIRALVKKLTGHGSEPVNY